MGISGSTTIEVVGAGYFGNTLNITGSMSGASTLSCVGAITTAGGLNLQNTGITNVGTIAGLTNISGSGTFQSVGAATFGTTIAATGSISGSSTLSCVGAITTAGGLNLQGTGITNAGAIAGATTVAAATSVLTPLIEYTDGDDAITIADGGGVTFSSTVKLVDDKTLTFGSNDDWTIEYDEDGNDDLVMTGQDLSVESSTSAKPVLQLLNTNNDATGATLKFNKNGANVADDDVIGNVTFVSEDDGGNVHTYASIIGSIGDMTGGAEGGKLQLNVAEHDGTVTQGLLLADGNADGEIDVTIGAGADSLTTIAGDLDIPNGGFGSGIGCIWRHVLSKW